VYQLAFEGLMPRKPTPALERCTISQKTAAEQGFKYNLLNTTYQILIIQDSLFNIKTPAASQRLSQARPTAALPFLFKQLEL
jgi:uncharacterized protein YihD (DUF1040 family)